MEGGFIQGCAKKGGFNPGGGFSWGRSFLPPDALYKFISYAFHFKCLIMDLFMELMFWRKIIYDYIMYGNIVYMKRFR